MGNGRLDIGIGQGGATVWNPNVAVQNFGNILAQQKQQQEADNAAIAAELSKVKSDGLRNDADRQYFLNKYNEIKNNAIATAGERNSVKKALAQAQTRDALMGLQQYVQRSKAQGAAEHAFGRQYMTNPTPWSDEAIANYRKSIASPLDSPDVIKDFTTQQRVIDHAKVEAALKKMHNDALTKTPWSNPIQAGGTIMQGNKKGIITYQKRELPVDQILANDAHLYDIDRNVQHSIDQRYAAIQGSTPDETKMLRIKQAAIDRGDLAQGANGALVSKVAGEHNRKFNVDRAPDPFYAHRAYEASHPLTGGAVAGTPQNITLPYNGGEKGANVQSLGYVPINTASLNLAGSPSYNLSTGVSEPQVLSSGDHQLVGVGNFPFIKKGYKFAGSISQPNFAKEHPEAIEYRPMLHVQTKDVTGQTEDHLVPYDRLPANLPKATKVALTGFVPKENQNADNAMVTVTLNGQTGQIPHNKLNDFLKKYPSAKTQ